MLNRLTALLTLIAALLFAGAVAAQEVTQRPVAGFPHAVLYTVGDQPKPVVVILHGADGNDEAGARFGPILARMGYAAVGLPYYSPNWGDYGPPPKFPDLPGSFIDIRVDQLADLREALRGMPGADVERFGLFGASKGAEFALIAGSRYPWIDSIVAYAPTDLVWEGWGLEMVEAEGTRSSFSFDGQPLPFTPYRGFVEGLLAGPAADLRAIHENGRADHPEKAAAARIPVENYPGALLLIAGGRDAQWNAADAAAAIEARRSEAGLQTTALIYLEAGHDLVGDGGVRQVERSGGSPEADAAARQDAWPKVVAFMAETLAN
ncbi:acyl-CoA thioester hydrolase/BAAT C-terminal domain-containing protein [Brevundimonas sp. GCM10030266]|uniref:acyl-CoA thioester hydrolase/BAAT C-terminal domain-containing protein n=1 Tax=Brevundimonas sp. GCM10030266 TaxID=3273386 RepID=UPI003620213A